MSEQGGARSGQLIVEVSGDVLGRRAAEDLQPFLQHLFPSLQRFQDGVTQRRGHRQIYVLKIMCSRTQRNQQQD